MAKSAAAPAADTGDAPDILANPIHDLQLKQLVVEWVDRDQVKPNKYNPNKMTPHDRALLRQSLLEDGWTQPVVTLLDGTIVDGEQRWTTSGMPLKPSDVQEVIDRFKEREAAGYRSDSILQRLIIAKERLEAAITAGIPGTLAAITGGKVPITRVDFGDDAHKMISTIRHNRARGSHSLDRMAAISDDLLQLGLDLDDMETRLGMSGEEVQRLLDQLPTPDRVLAEMGGEAAFSTAWEPQHIAVMEEPLVPEGYQRSQAVVEAGRAYEQQKVAHNRQIEAAAQQRVAEVEAQGGTPLGVYDRERIKKEVASSMPALPPAPKPPTLKKLVFFVLEDQFAVIAQLLGPNPAQGLVDAMAEVARARGIDPGPLAAAAAPAQPPVA